MKTLNELIKKYIDDHGIKLSELSKKTGISSQNLSRILHANDLKVSQLFAITEALNLPYDYFIYCYEKKISNLNDCYESVKKIEEENKALKNQIILLQNKIIELFGQ
jgi:transcriptional regulator with XRE-family HTH domain